MLRWLSLCAGLLRPSARVHVQCEIEFSLARQNPQGLNVQFTLVSKAFSSQQCNFGSSVQHDCQSSDEMLLPGPIGSHFA